MMGSVSERRSRWSRIVARCCSPVWTKSDGRCSPRTGSERTSGPGEGDGDEGRETGGEAIYHRGASGRRDRAGGRRGSRAGPRSGRGAVRDQVYPPAVRCGCGWRGGRWGPDPRCDPRGRDPRRRRAARRGGRPRARPGAPASPARDRAARAASPARRVREPAPRVGPPGPARPLAPQAGSSPWSGSADRARAHGRAVLWRATRATLGGGPGLFEPIHGSAPDIAGRGVANPIGAIASVALLLRHGLGLPDAADAVDRGIEQAIETGARTRDIAEPGGPELGTRAMGERIAEAVRIAECGVRSGDSLGDSALRIPHSALE